MAKNSTPPDKLELSWSGLLCYSQVVVLVSGRAFVEVAGSSTFGRPGAVAALALAAGPALWAAYWAAQRYRNQ